MAGLMEGYLGGLRFLSGLQDMQQRKEDQQYQMQQRMEAAQTNRQSKSVLADVFKKRAEDVGVTDSLTLQNRLANQFQTAGTDLMAVDPKSGIGMLKQAEDLRTRIQNAAIEQVQVGMNQDKLLAGRATTVYDQGSLDSFIADSAKAGKTIPSQYRTWGPATEAWIKRQTMLGVTGLQLKELEIKTAREKVLEAQQKTREERELLREKTDAAREARLRTGMEVKTRAATTKATSEFAMKGEKDREAEIGVLTDSDPQGVFKSLPQGKKVEAAMDVRMRAQKIFADSLLGMEDGDAISKEEALRQARESVLGEIVVDGASWNPFKTVTRDAGSKEPERPVGPARKEAQGKSSGPVGKPAISPLPTSKDSLVSGQVYNTARGPALWKGDHFESLK